MTIDKKVNKPGVNKVATSKSIRSVNEINYKLANLNLSGDQIKKYDPIDPDNKQSPKSYESCWEFTPDPICSFPSRRSHRYPTIDEQRQEFDDLSIAR
ncbi:hypothetical protein G210_0696, partial [Candida maltosa Xu316]